MNSGAGQQGKALTAAQKLQNYTKLYKTKIKIQINICNQLTQTLNSISRYLVTLSATIRYDNDSIRYAASVLCDDVEKSSYTRDSSAPVSFRKVFENAERDTFWTRE